MSLLSVYANALRSALGIIPKKEGRELPELQKIRDESRQQTRHSQDNNKTVLHGSV